MKALSCLGQHRPDNHRVFFSTGMHDLPSGFIEPGQQMADKYVYLLIVAGMARAFGVFRAMVMIGPTASRPSLM